VEDNDPVRGDESSEGGSSPVDAEYGIDRLE
jgi:hypothetical protein